MITIDKKIMHGKPIVAGTRVLVSTVIGSVASGMTATEIETEYGISKDAIKACLEYAAQLIEDEEVYLSATH